MNRSHTITLAFCYLLFVHQALSAEHFVSGKPVWPTGREKEKNITVGFRAVFEAPVEGRVVLRVAASSIYRFFVNGKFGGHGPARGPHGYYRVDEWDLTGSLAPGENLVAVEVTGYNVNSYYLLDQPAFLQAEIDSDGRVLASSHGEGAAFEALILEERLKKVQRYSSQRTFTEGYRLRPGFDSWRKNISASFQPVECSVFPDKKLIPRRVHYPEFALCQPRWDISRGTLKPVAEPKEIWKGRPMTEIGPTLLGFGENELEAIPSFELQKFVTDSEEKTDRPFLEPPKLNLQANSYHILDLGTNLTGFVGARVTCRKNTRLLITFDELLTRGDVDFKRLGCANIISYEMPEGVYEVESVEPYTMRYLKFTVLEGDCEVDGILLREYVNPDAWESDFASSDDRLNRLFAAGRETFRQNAVDIFMDCPSRERAGWLCDSYFTARAEADLCGNTLVEKNFLENFILPSKFEHLPPGMLPMCYPADHFSGRFIPNWALWFVVQLEDYLARSGDRASVDAARQKIMSLFDYFEKFRNPDGLLEKLESWVFIEWSEANNFVQDVNYPTNMLYAGALESAGRMYAMPELVRKAESVREAVRRQSFDGEFFVDNAVRKDGKLEVTRNRTEVCQYYAFFFKAATPESHPALWRVLREDFGPKRMKTGAFPQIHRSRPFIGNMLRVEVLSNYGLSSQVLEESLDYFLGMADRTGTLWEYDNPGASCNHGFGSHIVHTLYRDVLGIRRIDPVSREVALRFSDLPLDWCRGRIPVEGGEVSVKWWKEGRKILYRVRVPAGFSITVENPGGAELVPQP